MRIARERRNVLPCFPRNTRRVNFYRRGKTQRAKNCIAIFFPRAIFKLLERVRLPSRNSFSSLRNMFMFMPPCNVQGSYPPFGNKSFEDTFYIPGRLPSTRFMERTFFLSGTSADEKYRVSKFVVRFWSRWFATRRPAEIAEGRRVEGYARGEQSPPFIRSRLFMPVVNDRRVKSAAFLSSFYYNRKKDPKRRSPIITTHCNFY